MRLVLIRHGETEWNKEFRLQGTSDVALSDIGNWQAEQLAEKCIYKPDHIFVSPLQRAQCFVAPLAGRYGITPAIRQELREMSFGRWEGLCYADMDPAAQLQYAAWTQDPVRNCPPDGEPASAMAIRVSGFLDDMKTTMGEEETAVVVTHGGVIRVAVTLAMEMPDRAAARLQINTASVSVLDYYAECWYLVKLNDTCHIL